MYKKKKTLLLFLLPAFIFIAIYQYYPFLQNIKNSFMKIDSLGQTGTEWNKPWYENYIKLFTDETARVALLNTLKLIAAATLIQVGFGLLLALMVDNITIGARVFRSVYFFPIIISATALGLMFNLIFLYDKGLLNQLLERMGRETLTDWKGGSLAMFTLMLPVIWQYVGFYFIILLTGLEQIPGELYEAAVMDGAVKWQKIWYITMPMLRGVLCTCVVLAITGAIKTFDLPWTMFPQGMPMKSTFLTGTYMYYQTMEVGNVDYGSALAVMTVVLGTSLARLINVVAKIEK